MFSSSANCARIPPADLLVDPAASTSRSSSTTSTTPSLRRWKAVAAPRAPPPITTTSALLAGVVQDLAERLELPGGVSVPLEHDELLDREVIRRGGLQLHPRIEERICDVQTAERLHQARPRRVLARVL